MTTLRLGKSLSLPIAVALACFALSPAPKVFGVTPAPDGGYPNQTTAEGTNALFSLTSGINNTALGFDALWHNTTGGYNTATGEQTLYSNVNGTYNTGAGYRALFSNTGSKNTADGFRALYSNTDGSQNTAAGFQALYFNTTGSSNTAAGLDALYYNTIGNSNVANGHLALFHNTTGSGNVAIGDGALSKNTTAGIDTTDGTSVAVGYQALENNTAQDNNALGFQALRNNTTGLYNNAFGWKALFSNATGNSNTAIGDAAGDDITGSGNVCLGAGTPGDPSVDDTTWIRNVYSSVASGRAVYVNSDNKVGTLSSSRRYKDEIKSMEKASEAILSLRPVTFRYKKEVDPTRSLSFGLIAEEVAKIDTDLVTADRDGKPQTVRYEAVNAMLLNEFLKEHKKVQNLEATVALQQKGMEVLTAQLKEQAAQIQKVSAQIEMNKPAPRVVVNRP